jgi:hypothetical protein
MINELLKHLDYGAFAEAALAIFVIVFVAIAARTLFTASAKTDRWSQIVLDNSQETQEDMK